ANESVSTAQNVPVAPADVTTTAVLTVPATATTGVAVNLVATISPTPTGGTVQFMDGNTKLGQPASVVDGKATLNYAFPNAGTSHVTAIYSGITGHLTSTSEVSTVTVVDAPGTGGGDTGGSLGNIFGSLGSIFGS
ncbi:hypothetical protein B2J88_52360, partial [Rhodococcus sp. SRB_17]|nr:hypothetical protein [Rhodococcus sp. SRB_17]